MDYYYTQCDGKNVVKVLKTLRESPKNIEDDHIFIDPLDSLDRWDDLIQLMKGGDSLCISGIPEMSVDTNEFRDKLQKLKDKEIKVYGLDDKEYDVELMLKVVEFTLSDGLYKLKQKQREGIEKALKEKKNGTGEYGRPRIALPDDFEESIKLVLSKQMSHEVYRAKIGMKKSTYFKVVRELRDSWKTSN